jgi:hypothetical protein
MKTTIVLSVFAVLLALCSMSSAQPPDAPSQVKAVATTSSPYQFLEGTPSVSVSFFTTENKIEILVLTGLYAFDGFTTQHARILEGGHFVEMNPLARSLVQTPGGQVVAGVLGMSATVGTAYFLHRFHHDRPARWFMRANVAGETLNALALAVTTYGPSRRIW